MKDTLFGYILYILSVPILTTLALGQDSSGSDLKVIELSPFHVQAADDVAYQTTNSQSATRMNVPLRDVPFNLQVINQQFMEDTMSFGGAALNFGGGANREAVSWMGSVEGKSVRGFNTLEFLRNGFLRYSDNGSATIERIEVVKGPTSILDGVTQPGGVINVVTKKPNPHRDFSKYKLAYGTPLNRIIANFDVNRRLVLGTDGDAKVTFRLVGGMERSEYFTKFRKRRLENIMPSLTFQPTEKTLIGLQHEYYTVNGERGNADEGFRRTISVDDANGLNGEIPLYIHTNGVVREGMAWDGPDYSTPEHVNDTLISVEHRFQDNLVFNLDFNNHDRQVNWGPTTRSTGVEVEENGDIFFERSWQHQDRLQTVEGLRGNLAWTLYGASQTHNFVAGFLSQFDKSTNESNRWLGEDGEYIVERFNVLLQDPVLDSPIPSGFELRDRDLSQQETLSFYLNHHTKWFEGKLTTLVGIYDANLDITRWVVDRETGVKTLRDDYTAGKTMPQIGAIFSVNDDVGVYVNYSQSMKGNRGVLDGFEQPFGPTPGEIVELGSKFDFNGKINGTISVFEIVESDRVIFDEEAPNIDNPSADPNFDRGANVAVGELTSRGFDADLYLYLAENFNTVFSYGYKTVETTADVDPMRVGQMTNDFKHKLAVFNKYAYADGPLEGLTLNGGLIWRSKDQRTPDRAGQPAYQRSRFNLQAGFGYEWVNDDDISYRISFAAKNLFRLDEEVRGYIPGTREGYYRDLHAEYMFSFDVDY